MSTMLHGPLTECVREFFDSHGLECDAFDPKDITSAAEHEFGSMVGFRGPHISGGLAFIAPIQLVKELLPVPPVSERLELQLRDWSAEIANQILGRLKNKLCRTAIDFTIGSPVCFRGAHVELVLLPDTGGLSLAFRCRTSSFRVHVDCSIAADLPPPPSIRFRRSAASEGELILF